MNEELIEAVSDLITKSISILKEGGEFLVGQLPEYISQLIMWYGVYNGILFIISLILFYVAVRWPFWISTREERVKHNKKDGVPWQLLYIFSVPLIFVGIFFINLTWLKIWIAPKVWLVEYAMSLSK